MAIYTYYVDENGDDGTGDGSSGNPWATIAHAVATMDYAGSTGVNIICSGALAITANLTNSLTAAKPLVVSGDATVTISGSSSVLVNGFWTFVGITFINNNSSTAMFNNCSSSAFIDCTFKKATGNNSYLISGGNYNRYVRCVFDATRPSIGAGVLATIGSYHSFMECTFKHCSEWGVLMQKMNRFSRCKFYDCGGVYAYDAINMFSHCYMQIGAYASSAVFQTAGSGQYMLENNVLESDGATNVFATNVSIARSTGNYTKSLATGSPNIVGSNGLTTLTNAPYADPDNEDWTLSAELSALTTSSGLTPGPVQATGGGLFRHPGMSGGFNG